jgi:DNA-binding beta-propeller fold protein YncE
MRKGTVRGPAFAELPPSTPNVPRQDRTMFSQKEVFVERLSYCIIQRNNVISLGEELLVILAAGALTGCTTPLGPPPPGPKTRVYVADITQNNVLAYIINDFLTGTLTPAGSPIAANCNGPAAFAKTPSGKFAYVLCAHSNQFSGFAIDRGTNGLTPAGTFTTGNNPVAAAIDPGSRFLYVANSGSNSVTGFSIDSATGAATAIAGATVTTKFAPNGLAIDPGGGFLYVSTAFGNSGDVEGFSINAVTGALTAMAGSPFASFLATGLA